MSYWSRIASVVRRRLAGGSGGLLQRVRLQFVMLTVVVAVVALLDLLRIEALVSLPAYLAAVGGLVAWAFTMYRRGDRWRWLDLGGPAFVTMLGTAAGDYGWAFGAMYAALFLHGTYGSARRTAGNALLYVVGYEAAVAATRGPDAVAGGLLSHAVGVFVVAYLVGTIGSWAARHDEHRHREAILNRTGARLSKAEDAADVARIALSAVVGLLDADDRPHQVSLWRQRGDVLEMSAFAGVELTRQHLPTTAVPVDLVSAYRSGEVVELGPDRMADLQRSMGVEVEFDHGLSMPLVEGDQLFGLLFVATEVPIDGDTVVALERFMHEVSLADVLVRRQAMLTGVVENSPDGILLVGWGDVIEFASPAVTALTGRDAATFAGRPVGEVLFHRVEDRWLAVRDLEHAASVDCQLFAGAGEDARQVELAVSPLDADAVVVVLRDITERRQLEEEITYRAFHDPVTGLANRTLFNDRVDHALDRAARDGSRLAVALVDLDDFKSVNDVYGHSAGDGLLEETARRLTEALRRSDTCARFGGDEFAVLMEDVRDDEEVATVLGRVVDALRRPFPIGRRHVSISASVGVRVADAGMPVESLIRDADVAMYVAKAQGKNQLVTFEPGMRMAALDRLELRSELQAAIQSDQLLLHYQPIVELATGRVTAFEALVRWEHPSRGLVRPDVFIPVAEETGLIVPLGRWVLRHAGAQLAAWRADGVVADDVRMSVNLSVHQLLAPRLLDDVADVLDATGLRPQQLTLEVTETALMGEPEHAGEILTALADLGVAVAIDDFGTGYSSFAYLQRFPVDIIKVDRSFVAHVTEGPEQAALAHAIVKLAQTLRIATVAEGVEEPAQEERLRTWGCTHGQGWRWAPAMPADDVAAWLAEDAPADPDLYRVP